MAEEKVYDPERQRKLAQLVKNKQAAAQLDKEAKELKAYFEKCAQEDGLADGVGKIEITPLGNGVKFSRRAGSPSKGKLEEAGVSKDIIDRCSSHYIQMEVF